MNWGKSAMIKFKVVLVLSLGFGTVVEVTPFIKQPSLIARERVRINIDTCFLSSKVAIFVT